MDGRRFGGALLAGLTSILLCDAANAASITNGDFEAVQIGAPFLSSNPADIPGWTHTGTVGDALLWAIGYNDGGGSVTTAGSGNQFVTLGGGFLQSGSASWSTTITGLVPGSAYQLNFKIANEGADTGIPQSMTVGFASGSSTGSQVFTAPANFVNYWRTWLPETLMFQATDTSAVVDFSVTNQINDIGLDSVSVGQAATPLPPGWTMMVLGLVGIGVMAYRRKQTNVLAPAAA